MSNDIQLAKLESHAQHVANQLDNFSVQIKQLEDALTIIETIKPNQTIRVPIVDGIFLECTVSQTDNFFVNTGADIVVQKDTEAVKKLLKSQLEKSLQYHKSLTQKLMEISMQADSLVKTEKKDV